MYFQRPSAIVCCLVLVAVLVAGPSAHADLIAVFGDNGVDNYLVTQGHSVTLVTDAQIATPGFLNGFDAFVFTRDGASFGAGLSLAAAANVTAYVGSTGNIVLFNGDFADAVGGDPTIDQLWSNAANFVTASGNGFIGEFNGAVSALTSNSNGLNPLGLIAGAAGPLGFANGGSNTNLNLTIVGTGHPVTSGVSFPFDPNDVEFGSLLTGVDPILVLATFDSGNPAIIAREGAAPSGAQPVPEPSSLALCAVLGVVGDVNRIKRRRQHQRTVTV